jgi:hypothetical protein
LSKETVATVVATVVALGVLIVLTPRYGWLPGAFLVLGMALWLADRCVRNHRA